MTTTAAASNTNYRNAVPIHGPGGTATTTATASMQQPYGAVNAVPPPQAGMHHSNMTNMVGAPGVVTQTQGPHHYVTSTSTGQTPVYGHGSPIYGTSTGQTSPLGQTTSDSGSESDEYDEADSNASQHVDMYGNTTRPRRRGKLARMKDGIKGMLGMKKSGATQKEHQHGDRTNLSPEDVAHHGVLPAGFSQGPGNVSHGPGYAVAHGPGYAGYATPDQYTGTSKENYAAAASNVPQAVYAGKDMHDGGVGSSGGPFMNVPR
jgi:hypothetical protein